MSLHEWTAASFRDPNGAVFCSGGRIFRAVSAAGLSDLDALRSTAAYGKWVKSGRLVGSTPVDGQARAELLAAPGVADLVRRIGAEQILEHERIPFPSFPYEWPAEMLYAAALLTLELAIDLLPALGLKDATPYNVLFRGPEPVFIDVLSFERRDPHDPVWLPYAQFVRTFVLPLAVHRRFGLSLDQLLLTKRDGLEPEEVYRWLGPLQKIRPPFLSLVSIPVWLNARRKEDNASIYKKKLMSDPERARFVTTSLLKGLRRTLASLAPPATVQSVWTGYMEATGNNYSQEHFEAKERFVRESLDQHRPKQVLDVGCNTGHFSAMAARSGARVVAIDYDPAVAGSVWRNAVREKLDILPLVVNLTRPTPGVGWRNREWQSFLDRARGSFDLVLMLAVIHHMMVTERAPLDEIVDLAAELTSEWWVVEFVAPEDTMFRRLVRGREELYRGCTAEAFENSARRRFEIVRSQQPEGATRRMYLMRRLN